MVRFSSIKQNNRAFIIAPTPENKVNGSLQDREETSVYLYYTNRKPGSKKKKSVVFKNLEVKDTSFLPIICHPYQTQSLFCQRLFYNENVCTKLDIKPAIPGKNTLKLV